MKLAVTVSTLAKAVARVRAVAGAGSTIPILGNVMLRAEASGGGGGVLLLQSTDMTIQITDEVECDVLEGGETTVSAQRLHDALRNLPGTADVGLTLSADDPRLQVRCGRSRFQLPVLPVKDFPRMDARSARVRGTLDTNELARLFDKVAFAIASDTVRQHLNGAFVHTAVVDGKTWLRSVATDGHRMALAEMEAPEGFVFADGVIIPAKTVAEIRKLLDAAGETVEVAFSEEKVAIDAGKASIVSKVIMGKFVEYGRLIPNRGPSTVKIENAVLTAALRRAMVISTEKARSVCLGIEAGRVVFTATDQESGRVEEEIDADLEGAGIDARFNAAYLLDAAGQIQGELAEMHFADAKGPFLITDPADRHARFVVMPQFGG